MLGLHSSSQTKILSSSFEPIVKYHIFLIWQGKCQQKFFFFWRVEFKRDVWCLKFGHISFLQEGVMKLFTSKYRFSLFVESFYTFPIVFALTDLLAQLLNTLKNSRRYGISVGKNIKLFFNYGDR